MDIVCPYEGMKLLITEMPDGSKWGVDVSEIAVNRAKNYADEFDGDIDRSLAEDTLPLFCECPGEVSEWAVNQMNWDDFERHYLIEEPSKEVDFQEGWMSGEKEIREF